MVFSMPSENVSCLLWTGLDGLCSGLFDVESYPVSIQLRAVQGDGTENSFGVNFRLAAKHGLHHGASAGIHVGLWPSNIQKNTCLGLLMAFACFVFALMPSLLATPNTINEICGIAAVQTVSLTLTFAWSCLQLLIASVLAIDGLCRARRSKEMMEVPIGHGQYGHQNGQSGHVNLQNLHTVSASGSSGTESDSESGAEENKWQLLVPQGAENGQL